jgi:hypothetical protein
MDAADYSIDANLQQATVRLIKYCKYLENMTDNSNDLGRDISEGFLCLF